MDRVPRHVNLWTVSKKKKKGELKMPAPKICKQTNKTKEKIEPHIRTLSNQNILKLHRWKEAAGYRWGILVSCGIYTRLLHLRKSTFRVCRLFSKPYVPVPAEAMSFQLLVVLMGHS